MKKLLLPLALLLVAAGCEEKTTDPAAPRSADQTESADHRGPGGYSGHAAERKAIQQLLNTYGAALNASDAAKITSLFAQDGVFAAPGSPTATGPTQIRAAFDGLFGAVTLNLQFTPAEIVVVNSRYAFATSTSSGTVLVKANGQTATNSYRELWVFVKENRQWKIARYLFNQPQ
ncbi:YybH family protein [Hymenobacter weizhouensis]|uniref:YybH family protein n=1 Tax=Hymenobacter sp. YIM 151500-1 TaxID=2987689 RepID=UPI0022263054|nr:nuclear transport factor 2 family protein [Hymenobacter sp. YIM 151500-1]UYZ63092.1 nuclear transport factor 2 family protein [Hymenobacter sp. YIM 151500-1]